MIVKRPEIERALDRPSETIRCFLLYGPDDSGSRALADRLAKAMGDDAERIDFDGTTLAKDPALLADEAASSSLFGGARHIRVRANGDEVADAVEALLAAPQAGNPVAIVAGALKPSSRLVKLATTSPLMMACVNYAPEGQAASQMVVAMGASLGLRIAPDIAHRIFDAAAGDRAVVARELEKFAAFVDAEDGAMRALDAGVLDAVGAGEGESSAPVLIDAMLTGSTKAVVDELKQLIETGEHGVPLVRAALRRLLVLAPIRADADRQGVADAINSAGKALFWKDKDTVAAALRRWSSADLARLVERITAAQADLLGSGTAGPVLVSQELLTIARAAARKG